ncbi:MAG: hypothetical protein VYE64_12810 [Planctomycetota bacterium]|nr:hypothetical protein [Planctomycetota bacterium]
MMNPDISRRSSSPGKGSEPENLFRWKTASLLPVLFRFLDWPAGGWKVPTPLDQTRHRMKSRK